MLLLSSIAPSTEPCDDANYGKHEHEPNAILVVSPPELHNMWRTGRNTHTGAALTSVNRMTAPTITPTISVPEAPRGIGVDTAAACRTNRVL